MKIDVEKLLCDTIEKVNLEIYLQGTLTEEEENNLKEFCTYWVDPIVETYKDNIPVSALWTFDFNFYSNKLHYGDTFEMLLTKLKEVGFIPVGRGGSVPSDNKNFTGKGVTVRYKEIY